MTQATLEEHDTDDSVTVNVFINDADEETSVASTSSLGANSTLLKELDVTTTQMTTSFNPAANSTVVTKRARSPRSPSPNLKIKFRKLGTSWRLKGDEAILRRSKRTRK